MISHHSYFHWYYHTCKKHVLFNFGLMTFIWIFLFVALPFGMYENDINSKYTLAFFLLLFSMIWVFISYAIDGIVAFGIKDKSELKPKFWFWVFLSKFLMQVNVTYFIRGILCNWLCLSWYEYLESWFAWLLMIGIFYVPYTLYARYKYVHSILTKKTNIDNPTHELKGEGKTSLTIHPDKILFIKSEDNYIDISMITSEKTIETHLFRSRLKSVEDQLKSYTFLLRVHRSYLINMRYFMKLIPKKSVVLSHNKKKYTIPISEKYRNNIESLLN